jgi:nucleoside permease NupC
LQVLWGIGGVIVLLAIAILLSTNRRAIRLRLVIGAGSFIGQKVILNEFVAYSNFGPRVDEFSEKTVAIVTFALAGFANFGSKPSCSAASAGWRLLGAARSRNSGFGRSSPVPWRTC